MTVPGFTLGELQASCSDGTRRAVSALLLGPLAVHEDGDCCWRVSDVRHGLVVAAFADWEDACLAAVALADEDWSGEQAEIVARLSEKRHAVCAEVRNRKRLPVVPGFSADQAFDEKAELH